MSALPYNVHQQTVFVTTRSDLTEFGEPPSMPDHEAAEAMQHLPYPSTSSSHLTLSIPPLPERRIIRETFSSVPVVLQSDLWPQYQELGDALNELTVLDEDDEWKIESDVYRVACYAAAELMEHAYPAPKVFNHGPKSVVFNWTNGTSNLYLTISCDSISALVSTPKKIGRRMTFSKKQLADLSMFLPTIRSAYIGEPTLVVTSSASDPL